MSHTTAPKGRSKAGGLSAATVGGVLVLSAVSGLAGALTAGCPLWEQILLGSGLCALLGLVALLLAGAPARP